MAAPAQDHGAIRRGGGARRPIQRRMKLQHIQEPRLTFAYGEHVCPRHGIATYRVFDSKDTIRRDRVLVGAVGDSVSMEAFSEWLERCKQPIERDPYAIQL